MTHSQPHPAVQVKYELLDLLLNEPRKVFDLASPAHRATLEKIYRSLWAELGGDSHQSTPPSADDLTVWHRAPGPDFAEAVVFGFPPPTEPNAPYFMAVIRSATSEKVRVFMLESVTPIMAATLAKAVLVECKHDGRAQWQYIGDTTREGFLLAVDGILGDPAATPLLTTQLPPALIRSQPAVHSAGAKVAGDDSDAVQTKSPWLAFLLWLIGGVFGLHRFYMGWRKSGLLQLLLFTADLSLQHTFFKFWPGVAVTLWWGVDFFVLAHYFLVRKTDRTDSATTQNIAPQTGHAIAKRRPPPDRDSWGAFLLLFLGGWAGLHRLYMGWYVFFAIQMALTYVYFQNSALQPLAQAALVSGWLIDFVVLVYLFKPRKNEPAVQSGALVDVQKSSHTVQANISGQLDEPAVKPLIRAGVRADRPRLTVSLGGWRMHIPGDWQASRSSQERLPLFTSSDRSASLFVVSELRLQEHAAGATEEIAKRLQEGSGEALLSEPGAWNVLARKAWSDGKGAYNSLDLMRRDKPLRLLNVVAVRGCQAIHLQFHDHRCHDIGESHRLLSSMLRSLKWHGSADAVEA